MSFPHWFLAVWSVVDNVLVGAVFLPHKAQVAGAAALMPNETEESWVPVLPFFEQAQEILNISVPRSKTIHYIEQLYSETPNKHLVHCSILWYGIMVSYIEVYKSNTQGICGNLRKINNTRTRAMNSTSVSVESFHLARSDALDVVVFSFVRDPVEHLISGYSEWEWRRRGLLKKDPINTSDIPRRRGHSEEELAIDFIHEMLACKGQTTSSLYEAHAAPQTAFLFSGLQRLGVSKLDLLGRLEDMDAGWQTLGEIVRARVMAFGRNAPQWPSYADRRYHADTDQSSGFVARAALESVLSHSHDLALATCLLVLPDFACFEYSIPQEFGDGACKSIAQDGQGRFKYAERVCRPLSFRLQIQAHV